MKNFKIVAILVLFLISMLVITVLLRQKDKDITNTPAGEQPEPGVNTNQAKASIEVMAENLEIPWEIIFLPDQSLLVSERPGRLVRIMENDRKVIPISGVAHQGEGGLLGLALHPDFEQNNWLYVYRTGRQDAGFINTVERYVFDMDKNELREQTEIIGSIPGAANHDGGRIAFGPDGALYITTGDAGITAHAQNRDSLAGKILRINDDGSIPADNPFEDSPVYSYGHRNPQGLAWDAQGRLWATEHGRSGALSGYDEVNLIKPGKNYGWPTIQGDQTRDGLTAPVLHSGARATWAPGGLAIVSNQVFFTGLRGEALYTARINGESLSDFKVNFFREYGRLRVVTLGPDNSLYIATSNRDGRGEVRDGDDKIIKIKLDLLN